MKQQLAVVNDKQQDISFIDFNMKSHIPVTEQLMTSPSDLEPSLNDLDPA